MKCLICGDKIKPLVRDLFDDRYGAPGRYSIYQCQKCGFGRITPSLNEKETGNFYAQYYPLGSATPALVKNSVRILPKWKAWLLGVNNISHHYIKTGAKILDVGSASGVSLLEIKKLGGIAYGVEPDPTAGKLARKLKIKVHTGFITDNPFPGQKFDAITSSQVIEHTPDPRRFLEAAAKRLNKGGVFILSFPNFDAVYRRIFGRRWLHWHVPYHYNFFTKGSFTQLATQAGLRVIKIKTVTPNLWTIIQLRTLFKKPVEGKTGTIWAVQHGHKQTESWRFGRVIMTVIQVIASLLIGFVNRIIDMLGQGESFVVWLERKQ